MAEKGIVYPIRGDNSGFQEDTRKTEFIAQGAATAIGNLFSQAFIAAAGAVKNFTVDIYKTGSSFESAFAGVQKTVDATEEQLQGLRDGILDMSKEMPTAADEIAGVAEAAGQLGIKTEDILDFTKVMVNLGVATNMSADEAATALAKIANITGMQASDYSKLGSSIVALGNNFAATESEIVEMTTRLASAGTLAGLTETEMLALSTAMTAVGINAEAGGSSMAQTLTDIGNAVSEAGGKLDTLAETAGMTAGEFSTAWKSSPMEALQAFLGGLKKTQEAGGDMNTVLQELGMTGILQSNMLKSLALASDTLSAAVDTANAGWEENTALTKEAGQRYATVESQAKILSNRFDTFKITLYDKLRPAIEKGIGALSGLLTVMTKLVPAIIPVVAAFGTFKTVSAVSSLVYKSFIKMAGGFQTAKLQLALYSVQEDIATASAATLSSALSAKEILVGVLTGKINLATAAQVLWNTAIKANPIGAIITAISAFIAGAVALAIVLKDTTTEAKEMADSAKALKEDTDSLVESVQSSRDAYQDTAESMTTATAEATSYAAQLKDLMGVENKSAAQKERMKTVISKLNALMPDLNLAYDEQKDAVTGAVGVIDTYIEKLKQQAKMEAMQERLVELYKQQYELENQVKKATEQATEANDAYAKSVDAMTNGAEGWSEGIQITTGDLYNQKTAMEDSTEAAANAQAELDLVNTEIAELSAGLVDNQEQMLGVQEEMASAQEASQTYTEAQQNLAAAMEELNISTDTAKTAIEGYTSSFVNGFAAIQEKSTLSFDQLKENMEHNLEVVQNWTANLGTLVNKGLDAGLIKELEKLGPESAGLIEEMAKQDTAELEKLNAIYQEMGDAGISAYLAELGYKTENGEAGAAAAQNIADGMKDSTAMPDAATTSVGKMKTATNTAIANAHFERAGLAVAQGIAQGIRGGTILIEAAAMRAGRASNTAFRKAINSHSPSKLFAESGRTIPQGVAKGIEEDEDLPQDALESMVYKLQHSFSVAPVELAMANAAQLPAVTSQPVFNINLDADMEVDGVNLGRVVLKNLDDAASFTLRGSRS